MGLGKFLNNVAKYGAEQFDKKMEDVNSYKDRFEYESEKKLFELVYQYSKPGSNKMFNSQKMAAHQVLLDRGFEADEIKQKLREIHMNNGRYPY